MQALRAHMRMEMKLEMEIGLCIWMTHCEAVFNTVCALKTSNSWISVCGIGCQFSKALQHPLSQG